MSFNSSLSRRRLLGGLASTVALPLLAPSVLASSRPLPVAIAEATGEASRGKSRFHASAVALSNGLILITGGYPVNDAARASNTIPPLAETQIYDPFQDAWYEAAPMKTARAMHASVLLPDGRIAVVGGVHLNPLSSVEIYDPGQNVWVVSTPLSAPIFNHSVCAVGDSLIIIGGPFGSPVIRHNLRAASSASA